MSDFGNEVAASTLKIGKELLEVINNLIKLAIRNNNGFLENTVNSTKDMMKKRIDEKNNSGLIKLKNLKESGSKIIPLKTELSKEQMDMFDKYARQYSLSYAAMGIPRYQDEIKKIQDELQEINKQSKVEGLIKEQVERREELRKRLEELEKVKDNKIIFVKAEDIELIADITNRMNEEIVLKDAQMEKGLYDEKGNLNPNEQKRYDDLTKTQEKHTDMAIVEDNDFIHAINDVNAKMLSRNYKDTDKSMVVCDMMQPENYIKVSSKEEISDENNKYTATYYDVYKNDVEQECDEFKHGRFRRDTNNKGDNTSKYGEEHWNNIQEEMKQKCGIGNRIAIFSNEEDYQKYRESIVNERQKLSKDGKGETTHTQTQYKNYNLSIEELKGQLAQYNMYLSEENVVTRNDSNEPVVIGSVSTSDVKKVTSEKNDAEALNIGKQIVTYQELNSLQTKLAIIRTQLEENEEEYKKSENNRSADDVLKYNTTKEQLSKNEAELMKTINEKEATIIQLQDERAYINSKDIIDKQNADKEKKYSESTHGEEVENEKSTHGEEELENEDTQSMDEWKKDVKDNNHNSNVKNNENVRENSNNKEGAERQ